MQNPPPPCINQSPSKPQPVSPLLLHPPRSPTIPSRVRLGMLGSQGHGGSSRLLTSTSPLVTQLEGRRRASFPATSVEQSQPPAGLPHSLAQLVKAPGGLLGVLLWQEVGVRGMRCYTPCQFYYYTNHLGIVQAHLEEKKSHTRKARLPRPSSAGTWGGKHSWESKGRDHPSRVTGSVPHFYRSDFQ